MKPTIDQATNEVEHVIAMLQELQRLPNANATATNHSLRMAILLLHGALDALEIVGFETAVVERSPSPARLRAV